MTTFTNNEGKHITNTTDLKDTSKIDIEQPFNDTKLELAEVKDDTIPDLLTDEVIIAI